VAWVPLDEPWQGWFSEDRLLMKQCTELLRETGQWIPRILKA
jgi:8-oxo-dGTP diphosphatase